MQRQTISEGDERIIRKRRHRDEQQGERKDGERGCRKNVILSKITARLRPKYCTSPRVNPCSECLPEANRTRGIWNIRYKKLKERETADGCADIRHDHLPSQIFTAQPHRSQFCASHWCPGDKSEQIQIMVDYPKQHKHHGALLSIFVCAIVCKCACLCKQCWLISPFIQACTTRLICEAAQDVLREK